MATTSLSLGEHWEVYMKNEVKSGRFGSVSEVVRDALRHVEEHQSKLEILRAYLAEGAAQAEKGEFSTKTKEEIVAEARKQHVAKA